MEIFYIEIPIFSNSFEWFCTTKIIFIFYHETFVFYFLLNYRFLFILLGPLGKGQQYHEIGRSIATLMTDEVFIQVYWEHFPPLGTPNFWGSCIYDNLLWISVLCIESSFYVFTSKFPLEKICSKGVINSQTWINTWKPCILKTICYLVTFRIYLLIFFLYVLPQWGLLLILLQISFWANTLFWKNV